jgi:sialidase-1
MKRVLFAAALCGLIAIGCAHTTNDTTESKATETEKPSPGVDVYKKGEFGYPNFRIPAIVLSNEGTLLAFAEARQGGDHSKNDIVLRRSTDNGQTWGPLQVIAEMGGDSLNDPAAVVTDSGRIFLFFQRFPEGVHTRTMDHTIIALPGYGGPRNVQAFLTYSDDDGTTWSEPRDVSREFRAEDCIATGCPGVGIQLTRGDHKGRTLFPIYEALPDGEGDRVWRNRIVYSDDGGDTWQRGGRVPHDLPGQGNECQAVELSDGGILLSARNQGGDPYRKSAVSRDGGATWSPMRLDTDLVTPACQASVIRQSWPEDGVSRLVIAIPNTETKRLNGTAFVSTDEGETWQKHSVIYPRSFAYNCLVRMPDGQVGCLYERDAYNYITFKTFSVE